MTYKDTKNNLLELKQEREEILNKIHEYESKVADLFKTQEKRIHINMSEDLITIDLSKNRQVALPYSILTELLTLFEAKDLIISSPIRCKLEITLIYNQDNNNETNTGD